MSTSLHRSVLVAALATAAGCSSFEGEVIPDVVHAELAVDRNAPAELAQVDVSLRLTALRRADHTIDLWDVWLKQPTRDVSTHQLKLALPAGSLDFDPNEQRVIDLVNVGTTNADLIDLCHQAVDVRVNIRYVDDPRSGFTDVEPLRVTVDCTP
jgi:hypothetical protein